MTGSVVRARAPSHPRFEIVRRIGAGGFGVVYEAFDRARQANVALKTLHRVTPASAVKLKQEFRALTDVAHPGLLALHDLCIEEEECFFTMELVVGCDAVQWVRGPLARANDASLPSTDRNETDRHSTGVRDKIIKSSARRRAGGFDEGRLRTTMRQLVDAVCALHAAGKIHRDLKPSNVLVRDDGRLSILDYGLVAGLDDREHAFEGTPAYAAPEQAARGKVGPPADWYAVGVMLHEALTGALPFEGSAIQIMVDKQQRDAPSIDVLGAPRDLVELCAQLLERDPAMRPIGEVIVERLGTHVGRRAPVRELRFVGRTIELERLRQAFARRTGETGSVIAVEGKSGIGKTALVRAFLEEAIARDASTLVFSGRCSVRESVAYNAFDGVVDGIAEMFRLDPDVRRRVVTAGDGAVLARVFPVLHALAGEEPIEARDVDVMRLRAFAALRSVLGRLAAERPVILWVDDWQWADRDSDALLGELLRGGEQSPILVVLTLRIEGSEDRPHLPWTTEHLVLGPLDDEAAHDLARALVGEQEAAAIAARAGGHPLFLQEMAQRAFGDDPTKEIGLDDAIRARVAALAPSSRALVELLSIAVGPLEELVLARAALVAPETTARAIEELRIDRLVRTGVGRTGALVEPFHDRVREAIAAALDEPRRQQLHRAIASALQMSGIDDPQALVHHLAGAGARDDAAVFAEQAATRAEGALAFERAAVLLRELLRLGTHHVDAERAIRRRLADALANAHRAVEAAEEYLRVADGSSGSDRSSCLRRAGELLLISGEIERGRAALARVLEEFDRPLPETAAGALASLALERGRLAVRGLEITKRSTIDPREVERAELLRCVAQGLGMSDNLRAAVYQTRALRAALDLGDPRRAAIELAIEAIFRGSTSTKGRSKAAPLLARAQKLADQSSGTEASCWIEAAHAVLGEIALEMPDSGKRLAAAEHAFRNRTTGQTWALDSLRLVRALSLRILGNFDSIRKMFPEYIRDARRRNDRYLETTMRRGSMVLFLCDDDVAGARAALAETRWTPWQDGFHIQHWIELDAHGEIDLYEGVGARTLEAHAPMLRGLRWSLVMRLQRIRILVHGLRGRLLLASAAASRSPRGALAECATLVSKLEREQVSYGVSRAALLRAGIASIRGHREQTVSALRDAIALGDRYGFELVGATARARLGAVLGGDEGAEMIKASTTWMRAQRIRSPERILALESPGF